MANLSITAAWNESAEFLKHHFGTLFIVAVALIALPNVALQAFGPGTLAPGETPQPGLWLLLVPFVLLLGITGSLTISTLALGRENVVGDALRHAFRRLLPMVGATLIVAVALCLVIVPLALVAGIRPEDLTAPTPATAGRLLLVGLVILIAALFFAVRLMMMTPVGVAEPVGPVAIIARSWRLTSGHFWKLLGFILLIAAAAIVVGLVTLTLLGLLVMVIAGPPQPGSVSGLLILLVNGLLNAAFVVVMTTLVARLYLQLAGGPAGATSGS
jgi:hypothetical protein